VYDGSFGKLESAGFLERAGFGR
jgi:hypothetical protein